MPGRLFLALSADQLAAEIGASLAGAPAHARDDIAPGEEILAFDPNGLRSMRWGMIPVGRINARGRPVMETIINARAETVFDKTAFAGVGRAVVPVSGWFEWTGERRRKTRWRIAPAAGGLLSVAAITDVWRAPGGAEVRQVALVTCAPNADVAAYHHRMPVLLAPEGVTAWLGDDEKAARDVLVIPPAGRLKVTEAG